MGPLFFCCLDIVDIMSTSLCSDTNYFSECVASSIWAHTNNVKHESCVCTILELGSFNCSVLINQDNHVSALFYSI